MPAASTTKRQAAASASTAPAYEADALYEITLSRIVEGPFGPLSPAHVNRLKGKHVAGLGDAVVEAVPFNG